MCLFYLYGNAKIEIHICSNKHETGLVPKQLSKFCLADYVSKVDITYPKGNTFPEKVNDKNDDDRCESSSSNESEDSLDDDNSKISDLLNKTKNGTKYKKRKVPRIIRYVKYNKKKDPENYFREQPLLFVPWRNELLDSFDTYEAHYNSDQTSHIPKRNEYEHHIEELGFARQMMEDEQREYDQTAPNLRWYYILKRKSFAILT